MNLNPRESGEERQPRKRGGNTVMCARCDAKMDKGIGGHHRVTSIGSVIWPGSRSVSVCNESWNPACACQSHQEICKKVTRLLMEADGCDIGINGSKKKHAERDESTHTNVKRNNRTIAVIALHIRVRTTNSVWDLQSTRRTSSTSFVRSGSGGAWPFPIHLSAIPFRRRNWTFRRQKQGPTDLREGVDRGCRRDVELPRE